MTSRLKKLSARLSRRRTGNYRPRFTFGLTSDELSHRPLAIQAVYGYYLGWMRRLKLQMSIFSSGVTCVPVSRGISRPETIVGLRPLGVSQ